MLGAKANRAVKQALRFTPWGFFMGNVMNPEQEKEMCDYIWSAIAAGYPGKEPEQLKNHEELIEHHGRAWEWFNLKKD